jgi:hypothetical protein
MYPTLIVVLVHTKFTLIDDLGKTTHVTSIQFDRKQLKHSPTSEILGQSENMSTDSSGKTVSSVE